MKEVNLANLVRLDNAEVLRISTEDDIFHVVTAGKALGRIVSTRSGVTIYENIGSFDGDYWPEFLCQGDIFWVSKSPDVIDYLGKIVKIEVINDLAVANRIRENAT